MTDFMKNYGSCHDEFNKNFRSSVFVIVTILIVLIVLGATNMRFNFLNLSLYIITLVSVVVIGVINFIVEAVKFEKKVRNTFDKKSRFLKMDNLKQGGGYNV